MEQADKDYLLKTISRIPEWLRHDLVAKEALVRLRAEETLAAMLLDTLSKVPQAT